MLCCAADYPARAPSPGVGLAGVGVERSDLGSHTVEPVGPGLRPVAHHEPQARGLVQVGVRQGAASAVRGVGVRALGVQLVRLGEKGVRRQHHAGVREEAQCDVREGDISDLGHVRPLREGIRTDARDPRRGASGPGGACSPGGASGGSRGDRGSRGGGRPARGGLGAQLAATSPASASRSIPIIGRPRMRLLLPRLRPRRARPTIRRSGQPRSATISVRSPRWFRSQRIHRGVDGTVR
jgi:hypothetical protein